MIELVRIWIEVFLQVNWIILNVCDAPWNCKMDNLVALRPRILTPLNYLDWRDYMHIVLHNKGLHRVTMSKEVEPQQPLKKSMYLKKLDEVFGFMWIHISMECGSNHCLERRMSREAIFWRMSWLLFIPTNLKLSNNSSQNSNLLSCSASSVGLTRRMSNWYSLLWKRLGRKFLVFIFTVHSRRMKNPNWWMASLYALIESLI